MVKTVVSFAIFLGLHISQPLFHVLLNSGMIRVITFITPSFTGNHMTKRSPFMSKASFRDYALSGDITKALDHLGYKHPTEVQSEVIPEVLKKRDVVVKSRTGSGKTAAFGIPLCELTDCPGDRKPKSLFFDFKK